MKQCDVPHPREYTSTHEATHDMGRYIRLVGLPSVHRYLCAEHSVYIALRHRDKYRIPSGSR